MTDVRFNAILEMTLMWIVALIAGAMAGLSIHAHDASGAAAWSGLLMAIVGMVKEGRQSRTIDRMGQQLGNSSPAPDPTVAQPVLVTNNDAQPVPTAPQAE